MLYFSKHIRCTVLGIDSSKEAIDMAKTACSKASNIEFRCCDFTETGNSKYDVVFISNIYHFFNGDARQKLRATIIVMITHEDWHKKYVDRVIYMKDGLIEKM